jgi:adenosylmethionine-8-amino-7-oxononanoate aminotransferase
LIYPGSGSIDGVKGDHFIVAPPFVITEAELETLGSRLRQAVRKIAQSVPSTSRI